MAPRSNPEDIEYRIRLKSMSEFQYTTKEHSVTDVTEPNYFHNLSKRYLLAGDILHIAVVARDGSWKKRQFEVVRVTDKQTLIKALTDWREGGIKRAPEKATEKKAA